MSYSLTIKPSVEKDLKQLPKSVILRTFKQIVALQKQPLPPGVKKISGSEHIYRIRVGDYRVIYEVNKDKSNVIILYVRHRRDAYRSF